MIRPQQNSVQRVNIASSSTSPRNVSVAKNKNAIEEIRCYNCSKIGHYQSSCPSPRRPAGSCFLCHQMGHSYQNCLNRVKNTSAAITTQDREIVNSEQEVSVAFDIDNEHQSSVSQVCSLFDTGSPRSFISKSIVPMMFLDRACNSGYRGLGNTHLTSLGQEKCRLRFRKKTVIHTLIILPEEEIAWPIIAGRDLLEKLNVYLCELPYQYSAKALMKINIKTQIRPEPLVISRLRSFHIFKDSSTNWVEHKDCPVVMNAVSSDDVPSKTSVNLFQTDICGQDTCSGPDGQADREGFGRSGALDNRLLPRNRTSRAKGFQERQRSNSISPN